MFGEVKKINNKEKIVLLVEAVSIAFCLLWCFGSCESFTFTKDSFANSMEGELTSFGEDAVGIESWPDPAVLQEQPPEGFEILNCSKVLKSGAYEVSILYDSLSSQETVSIDQSSGSLRCHTQYGAALRALDLRLVDGLYEAESRFWLRPGCKKTEIRFSVWYNGSGRLAVTAIRVEEKRAYRVALCAALAFFMAFCDFLYLVFVRPQSGFRDLKKKGAIAVILGITLAASITSVTDFLYHGHDLRFHISRMIALADGLREMQIPHRMQFGMLNGYGYASPLFYGELFLLLPAILYNFYVPIQTCYQVFVTVVNFCTCMVSFWCFTKMTQDWKKGLFGAGLYTLSAYRMTNVMVRAAVGEYTAMLFLPLLVYGFWNLYTKGPDEKIGLKDYLPIVLSATGLVNAHVLSCEMAVIFILIFVLWNWKKTLRKSVFTALVKSGVLTLLLNLWFLVPFLMSMRMDVNVSGGLRQIEGNGVYPVQLFGIFHTASGETIQRGTQWEMPLALGLPFVLGLVLFLLVYLYKEVWGLLEDKQMKAAKTCMALGMAAVFMASTFCWWDNLLYISERIARITGMIQFPWRYLGIASVMFTVMILFLIRVLEAHATKKTVWGVMAVMAAAVVFTEGYFIMDYVNIQDEVRLYAESDLGTMQVMGAEYKLAGTDLEGYKRRTLTYEEGVENISFTYDKKGTYDLVCENKTGHVSFVDVPVQKYDNYHAYTEQGELSLDSGENNRIRVLLPVDFAGTIRLQYEVPLLWRVCEWISCMAWGGMLLWLIAANRHRRKKDEKQKEK